MLTYVHQLIAFTAEKYPNRTALQVKDSSLTYQQLHENIINVAAIYQSLNIHQGDRVGIYLPKTFDNVHSIFACSIVGAIFVPINPVLKAKQVIHIGTDCQIKLLITNKARYQSLKTRLDEFNALEHIIISDGDSQFIAKAQADIDQKVTLLTWQCCQTSTDNNTTEQRQPINEQSTAAILYTSGSTGLPKGIMLSHKNIILGAQSVASYLKNTHNDSILAVLPLSFDYGLSQLTTSFLVGARCVLLDYLFANDVIKAIARYKITGLAAVPPLWAQLCKVSWSDQGKSIRYFTNSGGALIHQNLQTLRQHMPHAAPYLMYGLTEAFRSTYLPPNEIDTRINSIGKAIPNARIVLVNEKGQECAPHEIGELVHIGPLVTQGYWQDSQKTKKRYKAVPDFVNQTYDGELAVYSGDFAKQDEAGFFYFVSRQDDMIKTSGYRVSPTEIDEIISSAPNVIESSTIGIPHPELGQEIITFVSSQLILKKNTEVDDFKKALLKYCQLHLANYMLPKQLIILDNLPLNTNGKIDRNKLKQSYHHVHPSNNIQNNNNLLTKS